MVDPERLRESYYETLSRAFDEHHEKVPVISDVIDQVTKNAT